MSSNSLTHFAAWVANGPTATLQLPVCTSSAWPGLWVLSSRAENAGVAVGAPALNFTSVSRGGLQMTFHAMVCLHLEHAGCQN